MALTHPAPAPAPARTHYSDVTLGARITYGGVTFEVTTPPSWTLKGNTIDPRDPRGADAVVWFVGTAVNVPADADYLRPFIREIGDEWTFQIRGDLAWLAPDGDTLRPSHCW